MSSSQSRVDGSILIDPDALKHVAQVIDSEDFASGFSSQPQLLLLPVAPGRFHAHWMIDPATLEAGQRIFGVTADNARLVLRAYEFGHGMRDYAHAQSSEDFPVDGLDNSGYFDLRSTPECVGAVLGLVNHHGHFRPLVHGDAVALPQPVAPETPKPITGEQHKHATAVSSLDEESIVARLPQLTNLPTELLKTPDELAFFERPDPETVIEAESVELSPTTALCESTVHAAVISGNCRSLPAKTAEAVELAATPVKAPAKSVQRGGTSEKAGASEQLASQWSDNWDSLAPINLRAELTINGRLAPGLKLALGSQLIRPLPGGYFKIIRKLSTFAEVWPLFSMLSMLEHAAPGALELAKDATSGQPLLEIHAAIAIEGRINDETYAKFLPADVQPDAQGRFSLNRSLPHGAVLLPGLSLIAEG